ncbi:ATP adenylyltransferase-domain-containing protein [Pseudomassariella vexata]|uniref:ATP adenylyltransferase-domain-containing protein n=1 Tax=Pseudomassariella vexata TaxID=1141098 RepID=A0A1Y2DF55_9PEZI|nr:ATP adenylyltransferase-domain-containing protein [Pseudomassariella vexata]ORY57766.1 ATP adenylyltransferase-domain-containing protein [Pseudomassariella vexata]
MQLPLSEDNVLIEFNRRHQSGKIFYDNDPQIRLITIDGFKFEFAITEAISKKPYIKDNKDEPPQTADPLIPRPTGFAPGSDINVSGYEVTDINGTHQLAFNKFCMYCPHLLLLTNDGYKRQYEHLDVADFAAGCSTLESLGWNYFMFFNCGKDGGCSRLHKHIQLAPYQKGRLAPWPARAGDVQAKVPYEFILRRFEHQTGPEQVVEVYEQMVVKAREMLGVSDDSSLSEHVPHNLVMGKNWMLLIPRRKAGCGGAYANALGMLGMVSVANSEELRCWKAQGPWQVLEELGLPRSHE